MSSSLSSRWRLKFTVVVAAAAAAAMSSDFSFSIFISLCALLQLLLLLFLLPANVWKLCWCLCCTVWGHGLYMARFTATFLSALGGFARLFIISRCPPLPFLGLLLLLSACHWNTVFLSQSLCVCLFVSLFGHPKTGRHHHHHHSQSSELWTKPCVLARWRLI